MTIRSMPHRNRQGFTLIELMATITILGVMIMLARPGYQSWRATSRQYEAGHAIALLFRDTMDSARETGVAHLIEIRASDPEPILMRRGWTRNCSTTPWADPCAPLPQSVFSADLLRGSDPMTVALFEEGTPGALGDSDICYEPGGAAWVRDVGGPWRRMTRAMMVDVERATGKGRMRQVVIPPGGSPRMRL